MPMTRAVAVSLALALVPALDLVMLGAPMALAQGEGGPAGDSERGKIVFRSIGDCVNCHGWAADGVTGVSLRSPPGASLRETRLDGAALTEVIGCGRPGTAMPYHDRAAYRDGRCHGLVLADFAPGTEPARGKTFGDKDVANVVAYLQSHVIGRGKPTHEECAAFFDNPAAKACSNLK